MEDALKAYVEKVWNAGILLEVSQGASEKDIRAAYKRKSLLAHPDRPGGSAEAFMKLGLAFETLIPQSRRTGRATSEPLSRTPTIDERGDARAYSARRSSDDAEAQRRVDKASRKD